MIKTMSDHECYMKDKIENIAKDVTEIKTCLLGDKYREEGLVKKVKNHDDYIENNKKIMWLFAGGAIVISTIISLIPTIINLINK